MTIGFDEAEAVDAPIPTNPVAALSAIAILAVTNFLKVPPNNLIA
jgi:hypothetical protein